MGLIGKSLDELRAEHDALQARIRAEAMGLVGAGTPNDRLVGQLRPLTTELVALKRKILLKTPRPALLARVEELERLTASLPPHPSPDDVLLKSELANIKRHLEDAGRDALTLKSFLAFVIFVTAVVYVPRLVADWLAP